MSSREEYIQGRIRREIEKACKGDGHLDLRKLDIYSFPMEIFECPSLKSLDLGSDAVVDERSIYLDEEYWWEVGFDNNHIPAIPLEIGLLSELELLILDQVGLASLPAETGTLKKLRVLQLRNNYISRLPPEIGQCESLEILDLSFNQLAEIPPEIGRLSRLRELHLGSNALKNIPPEIGKLQNLEYLDLGSYDAGRVFPETAERFDLVQNRLTDLPPEIGSLRNLHHLDISFNRFPDLPEVLTGLTELQSFNARGNPMEEWLLNELEYDYRWIWYYFGEEAPGEKASGEKAPGNTPGD